jgi:carboxyl-terminal processing protease
MPAFDLEDPKVDEMVGKFKKRKALILDLRGNGGGYETTLLRLLANMIDHDVKVADLKRRKENKPITAKTRGANVFTGKLVVLIDNRSGSAAELFSRVVQLEKRGIVIGDRSAGAVMRSKHHGHEIGQDTVVFYGASITDADMIMSDGQSLERVGVVPDELKLPTNLDLAARRDPVLAYAASLVGVTIPPEKAGAFFPIEWKR